MRRVILEVISPHVPDLTLVDMPGLVEVAMENQPHDVVEKVIGGYDGRRPIRLYFFLTLSMPATIIRKYISDTLKTSPGQDTI